MHGNFSNAGAMSLMRDAKKYRHKKSEAATIWNYFEILRVQVSANKIICIHLRNGNSHAARANSRLKDKAGG
jgi:hypothetical protein